MKIRIAFIILILSFGFFSCSDHYAFNKTKTGLEYHFFDENTSGKVGNVKDIYSINTTIKTLKNELVMQEFLMFERYRSLYPGDFHEGLSLLHNGDSAVFKLNADSFYFHHGMDKPKTLTKPNEMILLFVGVKNIQTPFEYLLDMNEKELVDMNQFVSRKKWNVTTDSTGIQYEITKANPTGTKVELGDEVNIGHFYYTLNEKIIAKTKDGDSWKFTVGDSMSRVPGLSRILTFMREGEKLRAVLPFTEAFGADGFYGDGVQIGPFTTIVIEVEVYKVKKSQAIKTDE